MDLALEQNGTFQNAAAVQTAVRATPGKVKRAIATLADGSTLVMSLDMALDLGENYDWAPQSFYPNRANFPPNTRSADRSNLTRLVVYRVTAAGVSTKLIDFRTGHQFFPSAIYKTGKLVAGSADFPNVRYSNNRAFSLTMQNDGNLVLRRLSDSVATWTSSSGSGAVGAYTFALESDGFLRVRNPDNSVRWTGPGATRVVFWNLQNDGNFVGFDANSAAVASTGTAQSGQSSDTNAYNNSSSCASIAVDASDNIHIVYGHNNGAIDPTAGSVLKYRKYNFAAGYAYSGTPSLDITLDAATTAFKAFACDIDLADGNIPVAVFSMDKFYSGAGANAHQINVYGLTTAGVVTTALTTTAGSACEAIDTADVSVACDHTITGTFGKYVVSYNDTAQPLTGNIVDSGLGLIYGSVRKSNGALTGGAVATGIKSTQVNYSPTFGPGPVKKLMLFSDTRARGNFLIGGAVSASDYTAFVCGGIIDFAINTATGAITTTLTHNISRTAMGSFPFYGEGYNGNNTNGLAAANSCTVSWAPGTESLVVLSLAPDTFILAQYPAQGTPGQPIFTTVYGPTRPNATVIKLTAASNYTPVPYPTRVVETTRMDNSYGNGQYYYGASHTIASGNNRNFTLTNVIDFLLMEGHRWYKTYYETITLGNAPRLLSPGNGSKISDSTPVVGAVLSEPHVTNAFPKFFQFQFATSTAFADGFTTQVPTADLFQYVDYANSQTYSKFMYLQTLAGLGQVLPQGIVYVRAREYDQVLGPGPWSGAYSWQVSHPPVAGNLSPNNGSATRYAVTGSTFSWNFGDPWDEDIQTAYQITVYDPNGNLIVDTGKVVSGNSIANNVVIPLAYTELNLTWQLRVWDSGDVASNVSQASFISSQPPAPVITFPANNSTITTAVPQITWTNGIAAPKTQTKAIVVITSGGQPIWSATLTTQQSVAVAPSFLKNANNYTITVTITDSYNLASVSSELNFATAWVLPAAPADFVAYGYDYDKRGYVHCAWTASNADTNFVQWNLYRRPLGATTWTQAYLLTSLSNFKPINSFQDITATPNKQYEYMVTQVINRFGDLVESNPSNIVALTPVSTRYWLFDSLNILPAICLYGVNSAPVTPDEYEDETIFIPGRGRHRQRGERIGASGSLSINRTHQFIQAGTNGNVFSNPAFQFITEQPVPDNWSIVTAGSAGVIGLEEMGAYTPSPVGRALGLHFSSTAMPIGFTNYAGMQQTLDASQLYTNVGETFNLGVWLSSYMGTLNSWVLGPVRVRFIVEYLSSAGAVLNTQTLVTVGDDFYIPTGNNIDPSTQEALAQHFTTNTTTPNSLASAPRVRISVTFTASAGAIPPNLVVLGIHGSKGIISKYIDGNLFQGRWLGDYDSSPTVSGDYYTAGNQKSDITMYGRLARPVVLRTPFGESWQVNIKTSYDPEAGTGIADFGTTSIEWEEAGF